MIGPTDVEMRVLGCLVEKQRTTPDHYPLTLNSLRLACNQSTNRDPVVDYDEATIRKALGELGRRRWIRSASGHTSRSAKYRHLIDTELNLPDDQISILAVLMLRGAQTPGELKQRVDRLHHFDNLGEVQATLEDLIERRLVERLPRRPGQKEERYLQLVGGGSDEDDSNGGDVTGHEAEAGSAGSPPLGSPSAGSTPGVASESFATTPAPPASADSAELAEKVAGLQAEVAELKATLDELTAMIGGSADDPGSADGESEGHDET